MGNNSSIPAPILCQFTRCELLYSCKGSRCNFLVCYKHAILPKMSQGRNLNSCCHVRRVGIYNSGIKEEMFTTQGLVVRFNEKGLARLRKKYNGKAMRIKFQDETQWCDIACKFVCCPCKCCTLDCCPELKTYELLVPGQAYVDGEEIDAAMGPRCTTCCLIYSGALCWAQCCVNHCENNIKVHHTEYELVHHEGDFVAPRYADMERSRVRGPASPRSRNGQGQGFASSPTNAAVTPDTKFQVQETP